jgi:hypothetical protein
MVGQRGVLGLLVLVVALTAMPVAASDDGSDAVELRVLSNRADLLSGDDALVEVVLDGTVGDSSLRLDIGGRDVTEAFAVRADGRILGRVEGLSRGDNILTATTDTAGARITLTNHPVGGPVFSGPQVTPWICTTQNNGLGEAVDEQCNAADVRYEYFYRSGSSFAAYDPDNPPESVPTVTTDEGKDVPYIIRQETGTQNRGIYRIAVLYNPAEPFEPWDNDAQGWNGKLYYPFGASCGVNHTQGSAQNVQNHNALSRGFMVATSSLNVLGSSCNTVVSAESVMMLKERIVDHYGEVRYTFGTGGSGGAIGQHQVANTYPGLLQGLTVGLAYPDNITTGAEVFDCHVLFNYFLQTSPHLWTSPAQQAAVTGHGTSVGTCAGWEVLFSSLLNPTTGCGLPADQTYHPQDNPTGARCTYQDFNAAIFGKRPEGMWIEPEQIAGGFAKASYDNIGIQFGLQALQEGLITPEQFVDLNEKVGGFDIDFNLTSERSTADPGIPEIIHATGQINDGRHLDQVAIIDTRGTGNIDPLLIHTMHHSFALKERMRQVHGHADNHAVWRGSAPESAFDVMDTWLSAVEADDGDASLPEKIVSNKPAEAVDRCFAGGSRLNATQCEVVWPYYGAPRIVAGAPMTHDNVKCQLQPLDRYGDYGLVPFTDAQWERLEAAFPDGVCDWSLAPVGHGPSTPWMTFAEGPGGRPLGDPPVSESL